MLKAKVDKSVMVKMLLYVLIEYKEKKVTKKAQRETCKQNVERLTKGLNEAGADIVKSLSYHQETDTYYSVNLNDSLNQKLDDMLVEIGDMTDAEIKDHVLKLTATIEPLISVFMGIMILTLALSIFLPIWDMYEAMSTS